MPSAPKAKQEKTKKYPKNDKSPTTKSVRPAPPKNAPTAEEAIQALVQPSRRSDAIVDAYVQARCKETGMNPTQVKAAIKAHATRRLANG